MMPKTLVNIKNLSVTYTNRTVLNKFSFSVIAGEIVVIVGANGCGKSTILKLLFEKYRNNKNYLEDNQIQLQGAIELKNDAEISYLPQNLRFDWVENDKNSEDYSKISKVSKLNQKYKFDECFNSTSDLESRKNHAKELKRLINTLQQDVRRRKGWSNLKEKQKIGAGGAKAFIAHKAKKMAKRAQAINKRVEK